MIEVNEIFIAYEQWHIDEARERAKRGATIVCFNFLVERELTKENIPCISLRDIVDSETGEEEWWLLAQEIAREWYRLPTMKFFEYKGIRVAEALEPILMTEYLTQLFYYLRIYIALKKAYPNARLSIPVLIAQDAPITEKCLVSFELRTVVDAARMAGFKSTVLGRPAMVHARRSSMAWKSLLVRAYNAVIGLIPHLPASKAGRRLKIYAAEYWSHIGLIIEHMDEVELVLMDNEQLRDIPWRQLFKHRIRTRHPNDEIRSTDRSTAMRISEEFAKQWKTAKKEVTEYLADTRGELDWTPMLEVFEYLITYAPRIIIEIDALHRIMKEEKPDVVLQLASVSDRQHQFFLMARVAAQTKIPSVELQHAAFYADPRVCFSRIETEYLATYGVGTNVLHERIGHEPDRLIPVGSPRFDQHLSERASAPEKGKQLFKQLGLDPTRSVLFVAVPYSVPNLFYLSSYKLADFFETIRGVQSAIPGMQVLFKCRNYRYVNTTREYLKELFHTDYAIAGSEDVFALLCASDVAVCNNSTVIYQAMLAKKPLVLYPWKIFETYDAQVYEYAAIPFAHTAEEAITLLLRMFSDASYREDCLARQKHFLDGCSFDGRSSERMIELIKRLSQKQNGHTGN